MLRVSRKRPGLSVVAAAVALVALAPASLANHGITEHASTGPADTNLQHVFFERISEDGSRAFFATGESLVAEDQDGGNDVYEYGPGGVRLISTGPTDPGTSAYVELEGASADGTRVIFTTTLALVAGDTDSVLDLYEREGNVTTLVSTGDAGGNANVGVCFDCSIVANPDSTHVFFFTTERLVAADDDSGLLDLYERTGGITRLASPDDGAIRYDPCGSCGVAVSDDGEHVAYEGNGIFKRSNGATTTRVPTDGLDGAGLAGLAHDGSRVWFSAYDPSISHCIDEFDTETPCLNLYEYSNGTPTSLSGGGNAAFFDETPDGSVFLGVDCGDAYAGFGCPYVIYRYRAGTFAGIAGGWFIGASDDGERVFFETPESLVPEDRDSCDFAGCWDVYQKFGGAFTLMSTGPAASGTGHAHGLRASFDGERVAFETEERLVADDTDANRDIYSRAAGTTSLLSHGPAGGNGAYDAFASSRAVSRDAAHVVFRTRERLSVTDQDDSLDAYVAGPAAVTGHIRPKSANLVHVSLVPAFDECTAPNREHGPPLAFGSCAPPAPGSSHLMVGVGDGGHPAPARSTGFVRLKIISGVPGGADDTTGRLSMNLTNVMRTADLSDYTGELRGSVRVRLTDREGPAGSPSQTVQDFPLEWTVPCVPTESTTTGATCDLGTDLDAIVPGATPERTRAIWALDQVRVYDGGPDEDADSEGDNALFAVQGVFVP